MYPEARSVGNWLRHGWHVALGYVVGFLVMLVVLGWHADAPIKLAASASVGSSTTTATIATSAR